MSSVGFSSVVSREICDEFCVVCFCRLTSVNRSELSDVCKSCMVIFMECAFCGCALSVNNRSATKNVCLKCLPLERDAHG